MMTLNFNNGLNDFSEVEKDYIDIKLSGAKVSKEELTARFGEGALKILLLNNEIKRYLLDQKVDEAKNKDLVKQFQADKYVKLLPLSLEVLSDILNNGDDADKIRVALSVSKPVLSYLERLGSVSADKDGLHNGVQAFTFAYPIKRADD